MPEAPLTEAEVRLLQRWSVRLAYDPALVATLHEHPERLGELPPAVLRRLRAPPRAAWGTDPERRRRALDAAVGELPVSCVRRGLAALEGWFSTPDFHRMVMERGSLVLAMGRSFVAAGLPEAPIELAIAEARRDGGEPGLIETDTTPTLPSARPGGRSAAVVASGGGTAVAGAGGAGTGGVAGEAGWLGLAPGVRVVRVPGGTHARWLEHRARLGAEPRRHLGASGRALPFPAPGPPAEAVLVHVTEAVSTEVLPEGLVAPLLRLRRPAPRAELVTLLLELGADDDAEAAEILDGLHDDGLLRVVPAPAR